jgi:hypothetical protein
MLTGEQVEAIERRAEAWVAGLTLADDDAFHTAVEVQLNRLTLPPLDKRRTTALALAEVGLTEASREGVFRRKDTISRRIFYGGDRNWYHGEEFRDVLEHLIALHRRWSAGATARKAAAEFNDKVDKLRAAEHDIGRQMFMMALQMVGSPLWEVEVTDAEGREVTWKPARWTMADLPRIADAASKLTRLSLGMAPGGRQEVAVMDWTQHLPDGITPAQAEAAMESWARTLAAGTAAAEGDEDDDE